MTKVQQTLSILFEAKSYKNHVSKRTREIIDDKIDYMPRNQNTRYISNYDINDTDGLIDYIEKMYKRSNYQVLSKYVEWTVNYAAQGRTEINLVDVVRNIDNFINVLLKFDVLKRRGIIDKDIREFNSKDDLHFELIKYNDPRDEKVYYKTKQAVIVHEDSKYKIVKINTFEAAKFFACGSRGRSRPWCIAINDSDWEYYVAEEAKWHFFFVKNSNEKYAIDTLTSRIWDKNNRRVTVFTLASEYPVILKVKQIRERYLSFLRSDVHNKVLNQLTAIFTSQVDTETDIDLKENGIIICMKLITRNGEEIDINTAKNIFYAAAEKAHCKLIDFIHNEKRSLACVTFVSRGKA